MNRIFKVYEEIIHYLIIIAVFSGTYYFFIRNIKEDSLSELYRYFIYVSLYVVLQVNIRELIIFRRIQKLKGRIIYKPRSIIIGLRIIAVITFFILVWNLVDTPYRTTIVLLGGIINYLMPKFASDIIFETGTGIVCKSKYTSYKEIEKVKQNGSGSISVFAGEKEKEIGYIYATKNEFLYEYLKKKIEAV